MMSSLLVEVAKSLLLKSWHKYLRTLGLTLYRPRAFCRAASSRSSTKFHTNSKTLSVSQFFLVHLGTVSSLVLLVNWLTGSTQKNEALIADFMLGPMNVGRYLDGLLTVFIPVFILYIFASVVYLALIQKTQGRRLSIERVVLALVYGGALDIVAAPLFIAVLTTADYRNWISHVALIAAIILGLVKVYGYMPECARGACGVSPTNVRIAFAGALAFMYSILRG